MSCFLFDEIEAWGWGVLLVVQSRKVCEEERIVREGCLDVDR